MHRGRITKRLQCLLELLTAGILTAGSITGQGAPSITSMPCPSPGTQAQVTWTTVTGDDYYSLWQDYTTVCGPMLGPPVNPSSCSFATTPGHHTLQINGRDPQGNWYSSAPTSMACQPLAPQFTSIKCQSPGALAQVNWSVVAGDDYYSLWQDYTTVCGPMLGPPTNPSSCNFATSPGQHTLQINGRDTQGNWYSSAPTTMTCQPPAPPQQVSLSAPPNGAGGQPLKPLLSWSASNGATAYDLYLGTTNPPSIYASSLTATNYTASTNLTANTVYYWNVIAKNSAGSAPASTTWYFTTGSGGALPVQVTLTSPANGAIGQPLQPTLSWYASTGATSYDIYLGMNYPPPKYTSVGGSTAYVPGMNLMSNSTYYWYVVATNSAGQAPPSSTWSFTTASQSTTVSLINTTHSGSTAFSVGDGYQLTVTGGPYQMVTLDWTCNGSGSSGFVKGSTNSAGTLTISGTYAATDVGNWTEQWYVGGVPATPPLSFSVSTVAPVSVSPSSGSGSAQSFTATFSDTTYGAGNISPKPFSPSGRVRRETARISASYASTRARITFTSWPMPRGRGSARFRPGAVTILRILNAHYPAESLVKSQVITCR